VSATPLIVSIDGPSASGKSTIVARAAASLGWVALAEAFDRIEPAPDLRFSSERGLASLERTLLEEDGRRWEVAQSLRAKGLTVVADTGFLGPLTYTAGLVARRLAPPRVRRNLVAYARTLAGRAAWGMPDVVVYVASTASLRRARAAADRGRHPADLGRRHEAVGRWEERFYRDALQRAFPDRRVIVPGEPPVDEIVREIRRRVRRIRPLDDPERTSLRVLELFDPGAGRTPREARSSATVKKPTRPDRPPRA